MEKKVVAVTPAGREMYLEILQAYVLENRPFLDRWIIWINTHRIRDINFCKKIQQDYPDFIDLVYYDKPIKKPESQSPFFRHTTDPDTIYVKIDDDILYMAPNALKEIVRSRIENPDPLIIVANTNCNGFCSSIHEKIGAQNFKDLDSEYTLPFEYKNRIWSDVHYAEKAHRLFINDVLNNDLEKYVFDDITLDRYQRIAINVICWSGKDFAEFGGIVDHPNEEIWLCSIKAKELRRPLLIVGKSIVSHFAFYKHRPPFCEGRGIDCRVVNAYRLLARKMRGRDIANSSIRRALNGPFLPI